MPTVNIFHQSAGDTVKKLSDLVPALKVYIAEELSCGADEVSVRLITTADTGMIAPVEIEITAHAFGERIEKQDEICLGIRDFIKPKLGGQDVRVWLLLPQLGHSWED
jgi:hypothetical protein